MCGQRGSYARGSINALLRDKHVSPLNQSARGGPNWRRGRRTRSPSSTWPRVTNGDSRDGLAMDMLRQEGARRGEPECRSAGMVANSREVDDEDAVAKGTACNVGPPPLGI